MLTSASTVAVAMMVMNILTYGFNLVAARLLIPAEFGAITALLSIVLIANVVPLGLQSTIARRIAIDPDHQDSIIRTASRVALAIALGVGLAVAATTPVVSPALNLSSPWAVVWCGAMLIPLTLMGAQAGVAQGTSRWRRLSAVYAVSGLGRILGGGLGLVIAPSATGAMLGLALGAWLPVVAGVGLLRPAGRGDVSSRRPLVRETVASATVLLAYFALSNVDALIARGAFDAHMSGLYAAGLILTKSTLFLPQFVSVVFFPSLARDPSHRTRLAAAGLVGVLGVAVVGGTLVLPDLAMMLVGGGQYLEVRDQLWLFAVSGTFLAVVYVLVFDALARRETGVVTVLWSAAAVVFAVAWFGDIEIIGLVVTMACVAAVLSGLLLLLPLLHIRTPRA